MHAERDHLVTVVFPDPSTSLRAWPREQVEQLGLGDLHPTLRMPSLKRASGLDSVEETVSCVRETMDHCHLLGTVVFDGP